MIDPLECRAKCPYFIRCGEKLIVCESYLAQGEVVLHFEGKASRNEFAKKNCDRYKSSCLHRRLMGEPVRFYAHLPHPRRAGILWEVIYFARAKPFCTGKESADFFRQNSE